MTLSYTEFLKRTPSVKVQKYGLGQGLYGGKVQKYGLGQGLYGGIEPERKGGGKYLYWRNSRYEKRIGTIKGGMSERKARRKVAEFQTLVAQGKNPITFSKNTPIYTKTFKDAADRWFNSINKRF